MTKVNLTKIIRSKAAHITGIEDSTEKEKLYRTGSLKRFTK